MRKHGFLNISRLKRFKTPLRNVYFYDILQTNIMFKFNYNISKASYKYAYKVIL